jgi:hypothetical protein
MFPSSLQQVREENHQECQRILQQTKMNSIDFKSLPETNIKVSSSKLIIFEHVYLLPEEVRLKSFNSILQLLFFKRQSFFNMLLVV